MDKNNQTKKFSMNCPTCDRPLDTGLFQNPKWCSCNICKVSVNFMKTEEFGNLVGWKVWRWTGQEVLWELKGPETREECFEEWKRRKKLEAFE